MLDAIYIISRNGLPLYFKKLKSIEKESIDKATLFSGAISAIQTFLATMDVGEAKYFATKTHEIYMEIRKFFGVVLIKNINLEYEREKIDQILFEITEKIDFEIQEIHSILTFSNKQEQILNEIIDEVYSKFDRNFVEMKRFSVENLNNFRAKMNSPTDVSITFLLDNVIINLESVIYTLLDYKPIIICGDRVSTSKAIDILKLITPFPFLKVIDYSDTYIDPPKANVIGVPQALEAMYKNTDVTIISLEKKSVHGLNGTKICRDLVKKLRRKRTEVEIRDTLDLEMSIILAKCIELLGICSPEKFDSKQFQKFKKQTTEDLMTLVTDMCIKIKPNLKQHIEKHSFFGFDF